MEAGCRTWIKSLQLICVFSNTLAFNLDTKVPIVKEGVDDSYFGFSLAQHPIYQFATRLNEHVLLVGAPRDNVTDSDANPSIRRLVRPGNVYKCPLTSETSDCEPIKVFRDGPLQEEDRNDQWLGVSVASQGIQEGKAVVCAHRYKIRGPAYSWGKGICMSMTNNLDEDSPYEPCQSKPTGHNFYGFCQAGTSVDVSEAGDILIGSPGSVNWRGTVDKNTVRDSLDEANMWYNSPADSPIQNQPGPIPATEFYSYLGMAAKICNIIDGQPTYIAGAPRAENVGQVIMFLQGKDHLTTRDQYYLSGEQFGSYFGYDMAVLDLNKDGKEDLAVGAPFFHGTRTGGAVYIFMNSALGITSQTVPVKLLGYTEKQSDCNDLDCTNARFGFSLVNAGDLDLDGYQDLVVGAPYEGLGAVYVFRGSEDGIIPEASQRIYASELKTARPLSAFGYSLAGGMDMDDNGYPDLAVGAYHVNKALVLRTRPVINIQVIVTSYPVEINPKLKVCPKDNRKNNCLTLRVCFQFTAEPKDRFRDTLAIDYTLEAEKFAGRQLSRVFFKGSREDSGHMIDTSITINEQTDPKHKCRDHVVYIIKNNRDFLNPIQFRVTTRLKPVLPPTMYPGQPIPDINTYPLLNSASSLANHQVDFIKNCGQDSKCHSNLAVSAKFKLERDRAGEFVLKVGVDTEPQLEVMVINNGEDAHETTLTILLPESVSYRGVIKDGRKEYNCVPTEEAVFCNIDNPLEKGHTAQFTIKFNAIDISPSTRTADFQLRVNTTSNEVDDRDDYTFVSVRVVVETDILVRGWSDPPERFYSGTVVGESAIQYEDEIGHPFKHIYEIKNSGLGTVARSEVHISWPYEVDIGYTKGKHLLYLLRYEVGKDDPVTCDIDPARLNPINVLLVERPVDNKDNVTEEPGSRKGVERISNDTEFSRSKRESGAAVDREYDLVSGREQKIVTLDCDRGSARCFTFVCKIGLLKSQKSVVITLFARLWNSTLLEEYRTVSAVNISSKAELKLDPVLNIRQKNTTNDMFKVWIKALPDIDVQEAPGIPLWVIIVAAIAGLLLLIIIIVLLWKCGFFKRTKHDDMQKHKVKVDKKKKNYHDYD